MPSLTEYVKREGKLPRCLTFSFAAFTAFYHKGERNGEPYEVSDDAWVLDFFKEHKLGRRKKESDGGSKLF